MYKAYPNNLKHTICQKICIEKASTSHTAKDYGIPLKTVEKWVTAFNKNPNQFTVEDNYHKNLMKERRNRYHKLNKQQLVMELKKRDTEIEYLKLIMEESSKAN